MNMYRWSVIRGVKERMDQIANVVNQTMEKGDEKCQKTIKYASDLAKKNVDRLFAKVCLCKS